MYCMCLNPTHRVANKLVSLSLCVKAAWRDEFAWLTYEPEVADSEANGSGEPAATGSDNTKPKL